VLGSRDPVGVDRLDVVGVGLAAPADEEALGDRARGVDDPLRHWRPTGAARGRTEREAVIIGVLICGFLIRGFKVANGTFEFPAWATPLSHAVGSVLPAAQDGPTWVALVKLFISMGWLITIALNVTMGVAWHRFLAFPNIFFKRDPERTALGAVKPLTSAGRPVS